MYYYWYYIHFSVSIHTIFLWLYHLCSVVLYNHQMLLMILLMTVIVTDQWRCKLTSFRHKNSWWSMIPPLLVILITSKPYRIWYTPLHVGGVSINRRECQRNNIIRQFGLRAFPPPLLIFLLRTCYFCISMILDTVVFTKRQNPKQSYENLRAERFYILFFAVRVYLIAQELSTMIVRKVQ